MKEGNEGPLAVLARIRRSPPAPAPEGERCDLCATPVGAAHDHVVDLESRSLRCACRACYLLFVNGGTRLRAVPDRYLSFPDLHLSAAQWDAFQIPVSVAFFFVNSGLSRVRGPLPQPGRRHRVAPAPRRLGRAGRRPPGADDDGARRRGAADPGRAGPCPECYLVPIDACYELVGRLRTTWRGFDGGADAHDELTGFFDRVRQRARPLVSS